MSSKEPQVTDDLVRFLDERFKPVVNTLNRDIREIDYRSGQWSVVDFLKNMQKRQTNGNERT